MKIDLEKELPVLVDAGIISRDSAEKIRDFYKKEYPDAGNSRLFAVFGIIGAILVGLGIILIIAHNWDELSRTTKSFFAFLPLLTGQAFCFYALIKKPGSAAWKESASVFLFFAVGTSISLVGQVYNIPGDFTSFILTWMALCVPLVYIMRSSLASVLYIVGITGYAWHTGYMEYPSEQPYLFWLMLAVVLPHYFLLMKKRAASNFAIFHHWVVPLSVVVVLGTVAQHYEELMFVAYFSLFGLIYSLGSYKKLRDLRLFANGLLVLGSLASVVLLIALSFEWAWIEMNRETFSTVAFMWSPEFVSAIALYILAGGAAWFRRKEKEFNFDLKEWGFAVFPVIFFLGFGFPSITVVLVNGLVFVMGITTINKGIKSNHLGILNYGLLIISALVISRFFDADISFVVRGLLFVAVGFGFFIANVRLLKKRNQK